MQEQVFIQFERILSTERLLKYKNKVNKNSAQGILDFVPG